MDFNNTVNVDHNTKKKKGVAIFSDVSDFFKNTTNMCRISL